MAYVLADITLRPAGTFAEVLASFLRRDVLCVPVDCNELKSNSNGPATFNTQQAYNSLLLKEWSQQRNNCKKYIMCVCMYILM